MFALTALMQKAQQLIDPALASANAFASQRPAKATLFRRQFRLPDSQNPLHEITAELTVPPAHTSQQSTGSSPALSGSELNKLKNQGTRYVGKLHLSEKYLCFSTQGSSFLNNASLSSSSSFAGQTNGAGPSGNGFTMPLCAVRRVERLNSQNFLFALAITTWTGVGEAAKKQSGTSAGGVRFIVQLAGSRQQCDRFCDGLKKGLREAIKDAARLRQVASQCYSEVLLDSSDLHKTTAGTEEKPKARDPPEAGLGMIFRYPGDARKLRDKSKMRLWAEYMRGKQ